MYSPLGLIVGIFADGPSTLSPCADTPVASLNWDHAGKTLNTYYTTLYSAITSSDVLFSELSSLAPPSSFIFSIRYENSTGLMI